MSSLKDALMKAGMKSTKTQNERKSKLKKEKTKSEKFQEKRNYCENCHGIYPDVERFKHPFAHIDAQWMCCNCADKLEIHDQHRKTHQSDFAEQGRYRRQYGPTIEFEGKKNYSVKGAKFKRPRQQDPNKKPGNRNRKNYTVDKDGNKNFNR